MPESKYEEGYDGSKYWYIDECTSHNENGPAMILPDGTMEWRINGVLHREAGPAEVQSDGNHLWRKNGKLHRDGGPAIMWADGSCEYWVNGRRHREDGPAAIWENGTQEWWLNGNLMEIKRKVVKTSFIEKMAKWWRWFGDNWSTTTS
jgi:hypothetical protein